MTHLILLVRLSSVYSKLLPICFLKESRHDKEKTEKKEKRDSAGGKEEKKQYPFTCQCYRKATEK